MGMSASQARLLSLTTRLTNNEFRAQTITNSKLRLADKSTEASQEYMDALSSQKMVYNYYNDNGEYSQQAMTAGLVYTYSPLKNQYAIVNPAGKMLVSSKDAANYENTNSLSEFLDCYGLLEDVSVSKHVEVPNPDYEDAMEDVEKAKKEHEEWEKEKPDPSEFVTSSDSSKLYDAYMSMIQGSACYSLTTGSNQRCYMHLLAALIGIGTHTTSDGNTFEVVPPGSGWDWNTSEYADVNDVSREVNDKIKEKAALADGPFAGKTVYQAVVDFMWDSKDKYDGSSTGGTATDEELETFWYIVDVELKEAMTEFDEDAYNQAVDDWKAREPQIPDISYIPKTVLEERTEEYITLNDKDKSQWYTNLWYMMNGSETANLVTSREINDEKKGDITIFEVSGTDKISGSGNYEIFEDNLLNSSDWLQFALEHGMVSLRLAEYFDPSEDSGKTPEIKSEAITWKSIVHTSGVDFSFVDDDVAIARAEVKYKNALREIEYKDKKYDQDLKKLDTEHTALETEYESLKSVISKNVERSFKAFS